MTFGMWRRGAALALVLGLAGAAAARAETAHTAAADFAAIPFIESAHLSPNGETLAGLFGVNGERRVCMASLYEANAKPSCVRLPDMMETSRLHWAGNDDLIVQVMALVPMPAGGRDVYVTRAYGFSRSTGQLLPLLKEANGQHSGEVLWASKDSPLALMMVQKSIYRDELWPWVYEVNVATGHARLAQADHAFVHHWWADGAGRVRAGLAQEDDSGSQRLFYRPDAGGALQEVDFADTRHTHDRVLMPLGFVAGTDNFWTVRPDAEGHSALVEVEAVGHKLVRTLYTAPEGSSIAGARLSRDGARVLSVRLQGKSQDEIWLDPDMARLKAQFEAAVPGKQVHILDVAQGGQRMLVRIDRPDSPGALYLFDTGTGRLHRIAWYNERLQNEALNPVKVVQYKARDGLEIEAILTLPKAREPKKLATIVLPHGGPWAHDQASYDYLAQFLAAQGYAVIQPNFRGSTGYGEAFERKGEGQLGLAMQDDVNDALGFLVKEGVADPARACIVGASYGGYAAMWGAARDASLWRCAVSISGVSSLSREVRAQDLTLYGGSNRRAWQRMTPDFAAVSPVNAAARISAPLLLIHGRKDVTVPFSQSTQMASAMKAAGKPVELVEVEKADHYFTREADREAMLTALGGFLKAHNPAQ